VTIRSIASGKRKFRADLAAELFFFHLHVAAHEIVLFMRSSWPGLAIAAL
jgi:hypothetical protein